MTDAGIHVRISTELKQQILDRVKSGEYRDLTEFVVKAIRFQLEEGTPETDPVFKAKLLALLGSDSDIDAILREKFKHP